MPNSHPTAATRERRTAAMAQKLVEITEERGACSDLDLHQAGFTTGEVIAFGQAARDRAGEMMAAKPGRAA